MKKESNVGYYIFRTILKPIYWLLYHPKIVGKENIPKKVQFFFAVIIAMFLINALF